MIAGRGGPQAVRVEGYRAALLEAGYQTDVVLDDLFNEEGGFRAAAVVLAGAQQADRDLCRQRSDGGRRHAGSARPWTGNPE